MRCTAHVDGSPSETASTSTTLALPDGSMHDAHKSTTVCLRRLGSALDCTHGFEVQFLRREPRSVDTHKHSHGVLALSPANCMGLEVLEDVLRGRWDRN